MTYDLKFTLLWMAAQNKGVAKAIASFYWDYSGTVFLRRLTIFIPMLFLRTFCESNAWDFHPVMTKISGSKISERCRKLNVRRLFPKTFEQFRGYLKDDTFSVLWYDFVRREKRTQSHHVLRTICPDLWVRRKKLSLMGEIQRRIQTFR